jgi:hypothetical protein
MLLFSSSGTMPNLDFTYRQESFNMKYENNRIQMCLYWGAYNHLKWTSREFRLYCQEEKKIKGDKNGF